MQDQTLARQLLDFLQESPSCYHAVDALSRTLREAGYTFLPEARPWALAPGGKYFTVRGDSSLIAFRLPAGRPRGFLIAAGHSDSPALKLRENAELPSPGGAMRLSVEPYGGSIWRSWMDRPLSVAGRITVEAEGRIETRLVQVDRNLLVIPSVAIHMNREVNKGTALDPAVDLPPLLGVGTEAGSFRALIAREAGVAEEAILTTELFLYPRTPGTLLGIQEELIAAPRLDDLQCVFACTRGFLAAGESESVPVLCVFNNEEVGSNTRQGADSTFLTDILARIGEGAGLSGEDYRAAIASSFLVSADNAHAVHPAHGEYADKNEFPVLGGGIVLKYNANQRYTTDALSAAVFRQVCRMAEVPVQLYSNRADLPGGSTLGNISSAHLSVPSVDIGLPQLAMHASWEVASVADTGALVRAMEVYFSRTLQVLPDGSMQL